MFTHYNNNCYEIIKVNLQTFKLIFETVFSIWVQDTFNIDWYSIKTRLVIISPQKGVGTLLLFILDTRQRISFVFYKIIKNIQEKKYISTIML